MITRPALRWWTQSDHIQLLRAQSKLFADLVPQHRAHSWNAAGVNAVAFEGRNNHQGPVCVLAHGFGSGLGFFYANVNRLLESGTFSQLILVDWMGMGGSDRPRCWNRPYRSLFRCGSWCDSHFSTEQSIDFFIDPLENFFQQSGISQNVHLVGHSLGGYLAARFALKYPARLSKLVLASPVGFPHKPQNTLSGSQLPTSIRLIDGLWSANLTPQTIIRLQGSRYGQRNVKRILRGRIPGLSDQHADCLAEYLYHITVAPASGEFAMNSLLEPAMSPEIMGVFARLPLQDDLVQLAKHITLRVSFGDSDWMRANEPSARKTVQRIPGARLDVIPRAGHHLYIENDRDFVQSILT